MNFYFLNNLMKAVLPGIVLFSVSIPPEAFATERGKTRQESRDVRQTGREDERAAKDECREGDEKSNAACRKDKRRAKQENRDEARDIKY